LARFFLKKTRSSCRGRLARDWRQADLSRMSGDSRVRKQRRLLLLRGRSSCLDRAAATPGNKAHASRPLIRPWWHGLCKPSPHCSHNPARSLFLALAHSPRRARERNVFSPKALTRRNWRFGPAKNAPIIAVRLYSRFRLAVCSLICVIANEVKQSPLFGGLRLPQSLRSFAMTHSRSD
jgi:hypothetical protein